MGKPAFSRMAAKIELWNVDRLQPYAKNSRTHSDEQVGQIAASITEFGFTNPVLVDSKDGIIAGHGRLLAAKRLNLTEVPVIVLDYLTDEQRRAYIIADNKLALNAGWNEELLASELSSLQESGFDVSLTGFSDEELEDLLSGVSEEPGEQLTDPDEVPEPPVETITKPGDVWLLGKHRLMCGSSTNLDDVDRLLLGKKADMVFTDSPYLMNFTGAIDGEGNTRSKHDVIANDNLSREEGDQFLADVATAISQYCSGAWYVYGWSSDYEPVLYGWNHKHEFRGPKGATDVIEIVVPSVWEIARTKKNDLHPTMKPVALCEAAILNSSKTGQVVLDLFGGSGSTLIAAEKNQRVARLMELEPKYCDVIVKRWEDFTGKKAVLENVAD